MKGNGHKGRQQHVRTPRQDVEGHGGNMLQGEERLKTRTESHHGKNASAKRFKAGSNSFH